MKETDFYPEICSKFKKYLLSYLPAEAEIAYSYDKFLPNLIADVYRDLAAVPKANSYIPKLKLDILFGIKIGEKISLLLFEVKYLKQLGLAEYSQLSGYLQVAKIIKLGLLFLVLKPGSSAPLSSDFNDLIRSQYLPMQWQLLSSNEKDSFHYKTGISYYLPNSGIEWVDTKNLGGIFSFEDLAKELS